MPLLPMGRFYLRTRKHKVVVRWNLRQNRPSCHRYHLHLKIQTDGHYLILGQLDGRSWWHEVTWALVCCSKSGVEFKTPIYFHYLIHRTQLSWHTPHQWWKGNTTSVVGHFWTTQPRWSPFNITERPIRNKGGGGYCKWLVHKLEDQSTQVQMGKSIARDRLKRPSRCSYSSLPTWLRVSEPLSTTAQSCPSTNGRIFVPISRILGLYGIVPELILSPSSRKREASFFKDGYRTYFCRLSNIAVVLRALFVLLCTGLGDETIPESSGNVQRDQTWVGHFCQNT